MPVAQNVEAFDPRSLAERPPRASVAHGSPAQPTLTSATGTPGAVRKADGTEELRTACQTFKASDSRPTSAKLTSAPAGVQTFAPGTV